NKQYGVVSYSESGTNSGEGLDFIIGQKFMEKYYAVLNTDSNHDRVGFAYTPWALLQLLGRTLGVYRCYDQENDRGDSSLTVIVVFNSLGVALKLYPRHRLENST
ncbi:hypothetical protein EDD22DRAFT_850707, partial [Suillus occidentalis]